MTIEILKRLGDYYGYVASCAECGKELQAIRSIDDPISKEQREIVRVAARLHEIVARGYHYIAIVETLKRNPPVVILSKNNLGLRANDWTDIPIIHGGQLEEDDEV